MYKSVLKKSAFYSMLSSEDMELIRSQSTTTNYDEGQVIFYEGTMPFGAFIVNSGKVKLYKTSDSGKNQIFQICSVDDFFGFHAVLSGEVFPDSACTLEKSNISFIPKHVFIDLIKSNSELNFSLLQAISTEFRKLIEQGTVLSSKPVRERVALVLCVLDEIYSIEGGSSKIELPRKDLADLCGTVKETLVRVLREFKDINAIKTNGRTILILNSKAIQKVAKFNQI